MDPLRLLAEDRARARAAADPMASLCVLATVDANGWPQARTLVLRDLGSRLALFMSATSPKFSQLSSSRGSSRASICVYLPSIQVQYRAHVDLEPVEAHLIAESWQLRPRMPKVLDWFYTRQQRQSSEVLARSHLQQALQALPLPEPLVAPETATGFYLEPHDLERLDLAQPDGLHDRVRWVRSDGSWKQSTLLP